MGHSQKTKQESKKSNQQETLGISKGTNEWIFWRFTKKNAFGKVLSDKSFKTASDPKYDGFDQRWPNWRSTNVLIKKL